MKNAAQIRSPGSVRILCEAAPEYGVRPEQCLEGTGLTTFDLYRHDAEVTMGQEIAAIGNFLKHAPDRHGLGIEIGRRYRPEVFGIWGYAILSSPTFGVGLRIARDFANLSFVIATLGLEDETDPARITFDTSGLPISIKRFVIERQLTVMANFNAELLAQTSMSLVRVETTVSDPEFGETIAKELATKVSVGCEHDAILVSRGMLDLPLPRHDPAVMEYCLRQCRSLLNIEERAEPEWTARVRETTLLEMANNPTIGTISTKLGLTERTLRRRLSDEGTSFRQIHTQARLAIGYELLQTAGLDVSTVAWRTGYSEPSSFMRAFSKQYGYPPGQIKKRAVQAG